MAEQDLQGHAPDQQFRCINDTYPVATDSAENPIVTELLQRRTRAQERGQRPRCRFWSPERDLNPRCVPGKKGSDLVGQVRISVPPFAMAPAFQDFLGQS
jgi:hypothetical protein